ncbi:MAG: hypothetical protein HY820_19670 [Acidobacteria bacterium]|nr:hypothetical protein [Acidobacteriota bacterium]
MRWLCLFLLAAALAGQPAPPTKQGKARELLDEAERMAAAVHLETHVLALMHIGDAQTKLDKQAAVRALTQAFSACAGLSAELGPSLQTEIIRKLAPINVASAAELVRTMAEPGKVHEGGQSAASAVVNEFLQQKDVDRAIEVLNLVPASAEFPFAAAQEVFEKIPADDSSRAIVFGRATEAYAQRSTGPFSEFLEKHWKAVPRPLAQQGLSAITSALLKDDPSAAQSETLEPKAGSNKGAVTLNSRHAIEFFRLIQMIRELDPARLDNALKTYSDLAEAVKRFPEGRASVQANSITTTRQATDNSSFSASTTMGGGSDDPFGPSIGFAMGTAAIGDHSQMQELIRKVAAATDKAQQAIDEKDIRKALAKAAEVPMDGLKAEVLAMLAKRSKDGAILEKSMLLVGDVKEAGARFPAWIAIAEAAHEMKDSRNAHLALERAFSDARRMFAVDTDAEKPNLAPRNVWPSIQASRLAAFTAAKVLGVSSGDLLADVDETDLAVLARIEMARQLLDLPPSIHSIQFRR